MFVPGDPITKVSNASSSSEDNSSANLLRCVAPEHDVLATPPLHPTSPLPPRVFSRDDTNGLLPLGNNVALLAGFLDHSDDGMDQLGEMFTRKAGSRAEPLFGTRFSLERSLSAEKPDSPVVLPNTLQLPFEAVPLHRPEDQPDSVPPLGDILDSDLPSFCNTLTPTDLFLTSDRISSSNAAASSVWGPASVSSEAAHPPERPPSSKISESVSSVLHMSPPTPMISESVSSVVHMSPLTRKITSTVRPSPTTTPVTPDSIVSNALGRGRIRNYRISGSLASRRRHLPPRPRSVGDLPAGCVVLPPPPSGLTIDDALPHLATLVMRHGAEVRLGNQPKTDLRVVISELGRYLGTGKNMTDLNESMQRLNKISKEILDFQERRSNVTWVQDIDSYLLSENELVFDFEQRFPRICQWVVAPRFKQWIEINRSGSAFVVAVKGTKRTRVFESPAFETRPKSLQTALWELENSLPKTKKARGHSSDAIVMKAH